MERMYFFDSTEDDKRVYQAADFARFHAQIIGNGVSNDASLPNLKVTAATNLQVTLGAGYMFANGYMYENSTTQTLKHDIASAANDRIDRVVIRFDSNPENRTIKAVIKKGTASAAPSPPSVTRSTYIHEMSVAQVRIKKGSSVIAKGDVTDERANDAVCGYIPLHNLYRGVQLNELGMVTMPKQSFIKAEDKSGFVIPANTPLPGVAMPFGTVEEDRQREVNSIKSFKAKADGVYNYWVEINYETDVAEIGSEIHIYAFVNGKESFPLGTKVISHTRDHFLVVNGFDSLKEGDITEFRVTTYRSSKPLKTTFIRTRVAKLA